MRLATSLIVFSFLAACGGLPPKPKPEICVLDAPMLEGICGTPALKKVADLDINNLIKNSEIRVPVVELDHSVMFRPKEWEKVQNYINALEQYGRTHSACTR